MGKRETSLMCCDKCNRFGLNFRVEVSGNLLWWCWECKDKGPAQEVRG